MSESPLPLAIVLADLSLALVVEGAEGNGLHMDNDFLENFPLVSTNVLRKPVGHFVARSEGEGLVIVPHAQDGGSLDNWDKIKFDEFSRF